MIAQSSSDHVVAVVSMLEVHHPAMARLFPSPIGPPIRGAGRVYCLFAAPRSDDQVYRDPFDHVRLVDLHHFDNEAAARLWIDRDIAGGAR
jgi:hypothetical protein